jgi:UTP:GlnB (protein PII) uridylyltransferase
MERRLRGKITLVPLHGLAVTFDDDAYPWHTLCTASGGDRPGLLAAMAGALDTAKVDVHAASLLSYDGPDADAATETTGEFINRFQVTDRHGRKLNADMRRSVLRAFGLAG